MLNLVDRGPVIIGDAKSYRILDFGDNVIKTKFEQVEKMSESVLYTWTAKQCLLVFSHLLMQKYFDIHFSDNICIMKKKLLVVNNELNYNNLYLSNLIF